MNVAKLFPAVSRKISKNDRLKMSDEIFTNNIFSGMTIDAVNEKFHHSDHCWVVDEQDVLMLMANL